MQICPKANCKGKVFCIDSRQSRGYRRRSYRCENCKDRWTTIEVQVNPNGGRPFLEQLEEKFGLSLRKKKAIKKLIEVFREGQNNPGD